MYNYPSWKAALWRFLRVFVAAFFATAAVQVVTVNSVDAAKIALVSCVTAGIAAVFKMIRDEAAQLSDDDKWLSYIKLLLVKLPI